MKTKDLTYLLVSTFALLISISACEKNTEDFGPNGGMITFGASTSYVNGRETRTEYSGVDQNGNVISRTSQHERIDWLEGFDIIKILCEQALDADGNANTSGTYKIGAPTASGKNSEAGAEPESTTAPFYWGTGDHYFYALYPAAGTKSNYHSTTVSASDSDIESLSGNKARITGAIPAAQAAVKDNNIFKPDMNIAYMYAAKKTARTNDGITLDFYPLVTSFEFSLQAFDSQMASVDLLSLELSSTSTYLTGGFTATLDATASNAATLTASSGLGHKVTITLPSGTRLSESEYSVFTVIALGVEQTDLTLTLNFDGDLTRSLALNSGSENKPIKVGACKKAYFKLDVTAPDDWEYFIGNLSPITVEYSGGTGTLASGFKSYKTDGANYQPVPFVLEYSPSGAEGTWSATCEWIAPSGVDYNGSTTGETFNAIIAPTPNSGSDPHRVALQAATPKTGFDLATKNVRTGGSVSRTTANCYVVDAPGTYKFPLVYGNAIVNGGLNQLAFRGNLHQTQGYWYRYGYAENTGYYGTQEFRLGTFRDHNNNLITAAQHYEQATENDVYIAQKFSNLNAVLVWEDSPGLVYVDYTISGSGTEAYITFSVPQATITEGNALIAVRSGSTILWSWHIWVTDRSMSGISGPNGYVFSPANVGWCDGKSLNFAQRQYYVRARQPESGKVSSPVLVKENPYSLSIKGNNPYYQWGRKDPMQAGDGQGVGSDGSQSFKHYYTYPSRDPYGINYAPQHGSRASANLGVAIQNPHIEFNTAHNEPYDWAEIYYTNSDGNGGNGGRSTALNLWNSSLEHSSYQTNVNYRNEAVNTAVTKTIYDPSPVGYKVPNVAAFGGFTTGNTSWTSVNGDAGRAYGSLFFPAVGGYSGGISTFGVTVAGSYFAASQSYADASVDVLEFTDGYVHTGWDGGSGWYTYKLNCWCVRPIAD